MEQTIKCPICSQPYKFYTETTIASDQSACPSCVAQAEVNMRTTVTITGAGIRPDFRDMPSESQQEYFGIKRR